MRTSPGKVSRLLTVALVACLGALSACDDEDNRFVIPDDSPLDIWRDDVEFVDATNVPQVQIDRFVEANDMDTVVTATGLIYQLDDAGGVGRPAPGDSVVVNYRGYFVTGQVFDETTVSRGSSGFNLGNPAPNRLIEAWEEGLQYMGPGGRMWMVVRPSLGYGTAGRPRAGIPPSTVLIFEIDLVEVIDRTP